MRYTNGPLVSVVITNYNYGDYVGNAIESALSQSYVNVEVIIIDDGSSDDSVARISKYNDDTRVKVVARENKGVIATRNEGVNLAKGIYILQLDADDILDEKYVEKCVAKAETKGLDIVYTQAKIFGRLEYTTTFIKHDLEKLKHDNYIHAAALVRRSRLRKDPYDKYLDKLGNEDWDLFLDLCLDGANAGLVDEPLLKYRKHINRKSRADNFGGLYNEMLVRHHVWSKQNSKHPDEFWYFSSQIEMLLNMIKLHAEYSSLAQNAEDMKKRIHSLERHHPAEVAKKLKNKIRTRIK